MLIASTPSASSMTIASRTIAARLSAGWSDSRCGRAQTEGMGLGFVVIGCSFFRGPTCCVLRLRRAYNNRRLRTTFGSAYSVRNEGTMFTQPEGNCHGRRLEGPQSTPLVDPGRALPQQPG